LFENKKRERPSEDKKCKTKKCKGDHSSERDSLAELEFINNAIKATKAVKKSKPKAKFKNNMK